MQKKLADVCVKFRLFQKPAHFEERLQACEGVLAEVKGQLGVLDIRSVEQDVVQAQLEQCMVGETRVPPKDTPLTVSLSQIGRAHV